MGHRPEQCHVLSTDFAEDKERYGAATAANRDGRVVSEHGCSSYRYQAE